MNTILRLTKSAIVLALLAPFSILHAGDSDTRIQSIAKMPAVNDALAHFIDMDQQLVDDLIELTEIPAPPFGEAARGERFAELLVEAGLADVYTDEVGNVIGRRPGRGGGKVVALAAHLDTVFPLKTDVTVHIDGDTYTAPGIGDNTRGVVALLGILRAMQHAGIQTNADILFIGNVGEEGLGDLRGVKHLFREGAANIDSFIAVDGGDTTRIVYAGVGSHRYRVTYKGPGGHSWGAFGTANPHHALGRAIEKFATRAPAVTSDGEKSSFNVGRIGGGTSINSVPFESWAEIDIRSANQDKIDAIDVILQQAVQEALDEENAWRSEGDELTVDVEQVGKRPAAKGSADAGIVQNAAAAVRWAGLEPELRVSSTDANIPISLGIPAVTLSRGGVSGDSHAPAEYWQNKDSHLALQIGLLTLLAEAGLAAD
jgi:acetylornithine deacetylase/succinyl-diaminopimelate desuccinylase-like protein